MATRKTGGNVGRITAPSPAKGRGRPGTPALCVLIIAVVEVVPSRQSVACAGNTGGVSLEEKGVVEGRGVADSREDDEEQQDDGAREENDGSSAERGVWNDAVSVCSWDSGVCFAAQGREQGLRTHV